MEGQNKLVVLWTRGEKDFAQNMALLYTKNAIPKGWFEEVVLIVWGPSAKLLAEDAELQTEVAAMQEAGVHVQACIRCTDSYGVTEDLKAMGIEVIKMGDPLTRYLKEGAKILSL